MNTVSGSSSLGYSIRKALMRDDSHAIQLMLASGLIHPMTVYRGNELLWWAFEFDADDVMGALLESTKNLADFILMKPLFEDEEYRFVVGMRGALYLQDVTQVGQGSLVSFEKLVTRFIMSGVLDVTANIDEVFILMKSGTLLKIARVTLMGILDSGGNLGKTKDALRYVFDSDVSQISVSGTHGLIVKRDGSLWSFGTNDFGELGNGSYDEIVEKPIMIMRDVKTALAGFGYSIVLTRDSEVWVFGTNQENRLGFDEEDGNMATNAIPLMRQAKKTAVGANHTLALGNDGIVYSWGNNEAGQLGIYPKGEVSYFNEVKDYCKDIAACGFQSYALDKWGNLWFWGSIEQDYEIYLGFEPAVIKPIVIATKVQRLFSTTQHCCAEKDGGRFLRLTSYVH